MQHLPASTIGIDNNSLGAVFSNSNNMRNTRNPCTRGYTENHRLGTGPAGENLVVVWEGCAGYAGYAVGTGSEDCIDWCSCDLEEVGNFQELSPWWRMKGSDARSRWMYLWHGVDSQVEESTWIYRESVYLRGKFEKGTNLNVVSIAGGECEIPGYFPIPVPNCPELIVVEDENDWKCQMMIVESISSWYTDVVWKEGLEECLEQVILWGSHTTPWRCLFYSDRLLFVPIVATMVSFIMLVQGYIKQSLFSRPIWTYGEWIHKCGSKSWTNTLRVTLMDISKQMWKKEARRKQS